METTVHAMTCDYRSTGDAHAPGPLELGHNLRAHFAPALGSGLDLALGSDPTVYVVRRVDCEVTLRGDGDQLSELARQMAAAVTKAILRTLQATTTTSEPASEDVVASPTRPPFSSSSSSTCSTIEHNLGGTTTRLPTRSHCRAPRHWCWRCRNLRRSQCRRSRGSSRVDTLSACSARFRARSGRRWPSPNPRRTMTFCGLC